MPFTEVKNPQITHYHGDAVRVLFVIAAGLIFLAELLDGNLPFSTFVAVVLIIVLVVAAGITNPAQIWIHWVNLALAILGLLLFGGTALTRFRSDVPFAESFVVGVIALAFLVALYLATSAFRLRVILGSLWQFKISCCAR